MSLSPHKVLATIDTIREIQLTALEFIPYYVCADPESRQLEIVQRGLSALRKTMHVAVADAELILASEQDNPTVLELMPRIITYLQYINTMLDSVDLPIGQFNLLFNPTTLKGAGNA